MLKPIVWTIAVALNIGAVFIVISSYQGWDSEAIAGQFAYAMAVFQSGFYMIPTSGYADYYAQWGKQKGILR